MVVNLVDYFSGNNYNNDCKEKLKQPAVVKAKLRGINNNFDYYVIVAQSLFKMIDFIRLLSLFDFNV